MTGYARKEGGDGVLSWTWEIKSVNGRALDIRCRIPTGYEALEPAARGIVQQRCARGNVQLSLAIDRGRSRVQLHLNRDLLEQLIALVRVLEEATPAAPPRLDGLLAFPGVVETVEEAETKEQLDTRQAAMAEDLVLALEALTAMRRAEGQRLKGVVSGHLDAIARCVEDAAGTAGARPEAIRERLRGQVEELLQASPALPEERLSQEAAVLITKVDVREEIDRLRTHVTAARELLVAGGPIGRRLDFLCQELNREANTLCAKSWDLALTRIGLDLKAAIDQLREQVQNIE
ncbi:MAG: YicC/YloC family endoribonuclease [Kiloniellaceae bacterium]